MAALVVDSGKAVTGVSWEMVQLQLQLVGSMEVMVPWVMVVMVVAWEAAALGMERVVGVEGEDREATR